MKYTQKISMARENVAAYIPELADTINSLGFQESNPQENIPPLFMIGPSIRYVRSEVDKIGVAEVTYYAAMFSLMFRHVTKLQNEGTEFDNFINMVAMSIHAAHFLSEYPEHAFKAPSDVHTVDPAAVEGKTVEDIYKELQRDPGVYGEFFKEKIEEYQKEQKEIQLKEDQEKLQPWLDS